MSNLFQHRLFLFIENNETRSSIDFIRKLWGSVQNLDKNSCVFKVRAYPSRDGQKYIVWDNNCYRVDYWNYSDFKRMFILYWTIRCESAEKVLKEKSIDYVD